MNFASIRSLAIFVTCLIAVGIVIGSLMPGDLIPDDAPGNDKLHHFLAFTLLSFPAIAVRPQHALWVVPVAVMLGGGIELIQPYFGRTASWGDFLADLLGIFAGSFAALLAHHRLVAPRIEPAE